MMQNIRSSFTWLAKFQLRTAMPVYLNDKDHTYIVQSGESGTNESSAAKIRCHVCGLAFATEIEKQKHLELEHMKNKKPAGVR
jgi:hypothetical protein